MEQARQQDRIGGVLLDLSRYPGEDFYCDGAVEDALLAIAKGHREEEFEEIIAREKSWPILYHLSPVRENIVGWLPFDGTEKVLEIGAGPGAITGLLSKRCRQVTCVELSKKRSLINAYRHRDRDNIEIRVGNFADIEPGLDRDYDYIFLIGVLEYAGSYLPGEDPYGRELALLRAHLKEKTGRLVIAIENRLGMKYFAGCREDHSGRYFDGIESYENVPASPAQTFSRPALAALLARTGFSDAAFYYPYPDYKFADTIYSEKRLPAAPELSRNVRNFDRDRLLLFDEKKAYQGILSDGLYPVFANSFEVVTGPALPVDYCRFSGERARSCRIRTEIVSDGTGKHVIKYPLCEEARDHVLRMEESWKKLSARYEGDPEGLRIAPCARTKDGGVSFSFIEGRTLDEVLEEKLLAGDREGFLGLLSAYREKVGAHPEVPVSDCDMTFPNLILSGGTWTAIDYEWAVDRPIPAKELLGRSLVLFLREDPAREEKLREILSEEELLSFVGITKEEAEHLCAEEDAFQEKIAAGSLPLSRAGALFGGKVIRPAELQTEAEREEGRRRHEAAVRAQREKEQALVRVKIYFDTGAGYREEETFVPSALYEKEGVVTFSVEVGRNVRALRLDPASVPCVALLLQAQFADAPEGSTLFQKYVSHNGTPCGGGAVLFATMDPWFSFDLAKIRKKTGRRGEDGSVRDVVNFSVQMAGIPGTMSETIRKNKKQ